MCKIIPNDNLFIHTLNFVFLGRSSIIVMGNILNGKVIYVPDCKTLHLFCHLGHTCMGI